MLSLIRGRRPDQIDSHADPMGKAGSMNGILYRISGTSPNPEARDVFVWCHDKVQDKYTLLGTGRIVGSSGGCAPPGISRGQYSVTVALTGGYSKDDIRVTDDKSGKEALSGFTVTPSSISGLGGSAEVIGSFPRSRDETKSCDAGGARR